MQISTLLARNLRWYWRTNLAVLLGVATATGVLGGALAVGESVRASLRDQQRQAGHHRQPQNDRLQDRRHAESFVAQCTPRKSDVGEHRSGELGR